jgi:hypothetical protein
MIAHSSRLFSSSCSILDVHFDTKNSPVRIIGLHIRNNDCGVLKLMVQKWDARAPGSSHPLNAGTQQMSLHSYMHASRNHWQVVQHLGYGILRASSLIWILITSETPMIVRYSIGITLWSLLLPSAWSADPPAEIRWNFGAEETTPLEASDGVHRDVPGPRPPEYPDFEPGNTAVKLDGKGAHLSIADSGPQSPFDFTAGDSITLEAWVQVDDIRSGENLYVICKGRTGAPGFSAENQNWALRIAERDGKAGLGFLFASSPNSGNPKGGSPWHRWTSDSGFKPGRNWHHVAITYKFGDSSSLRGWIDGKPQTGKWDMGGATNDAPAVDDDAVWIGSAQSGAASSSFRGCLDSIAIHRQILDDTTLKSRFNFTGKEIVDRPLAEVMPDMGTLEPGIVSAALLEGMPAHNRWLNEGETLPVEILRWQPEAFLLDRLPLRHDAWGIRDSWKSSCSAANCGRCETFARSASISDASTWLSRLWVDGKVIARAEPSKGSPSGEEPMTPVATPPAPGARIAEHRQQEVFGDAVVSKVVCVELYSKHWLVERTFALIPARTLCRSAKRRWSILPDSPADRPGDESDSAD